MNQLQMIDREGTFKAKPIAWSIHRSQGSQSVGINVQFDIVAKQEGDEWEDWTMYGPCSVFGYFNVLKKDGTVNQKTVENLAEVLSWNASMQQITSAPPPDVVVQVVVEFNEYNGKSSYRVKWLNPGDYTHAGGGCSPDEARALDAQFGSLLRASAGAVAPKPNGKPKSPPVKRAPAREPSLAEAIDEGAPFAGDADDGSRQ